MANYYYNGRLLPEIPSEILAQYNYFVIAYSGSTVRVYGSTNVIYKRVQDGVNKIYIPANRVRITLNKSTNEWNTPETYTTGTNIVLDSGTDSDQWFLIWSNSNIPDGSATASSIYFYGSEPLEETEDETFYKINSKTLSGIADQVRRKKGISLSLKPDQILALLKTL